MNQEKKVKLNGLRELVEQMKDNQIIVVNLKEDNHEPRIAGSECTISK